MVDLSYGRPRDPGDAPAAPEIPPVPTACYRCESCRHEWEQSPGPTSCPRCGELRVEWRSFEAWRGQFEAAVGHVISAATRVLDAAEAVVPAPPSPPAVPAEEPARLDALERRMLDSGLPVVDLPVKHHFYDSGIYAREIFMPAGTLLTSKTHRTEHPYVVLAGSVSVYIPGRGVEHIEAPYFGRTLPNTRRVLLIRADCTWVTFHPMAPDEVVEPDEARRLAAIEARIIERRELPSGTTANDEYRARLAEAERQEQLALIEEARAALIADSSPEEP